MEFWDYLAISIHRVFVTACSAIGPHDERMLQQANCASRPRAHRMPEVDREQGPRPWYRRRIQHGEASSGLFMKIKV